MSISAITNYRQLAESRLLKQFKEECSPNLGKLLNVLMGEIQEAETCLIDLLTQRNLTDAVGPQLDIIGNILGLDREGLDDTDYRAALQVQVLINNSGGEEPALTALLQVLTNATIIDINETFPAGLEIFINEPLALTTIQRLRRAVAATVDLQFSFTNGGIPIAFDGTTVGGGFGSLFDAAAGGEFSTVFEV